MSRHRSQYPHLFSIMHTTVHSVNFHDGICNLYRGRQLENLVSTVYVYEKSVLNVVAGYT